ncbi:MAG: penicillin-binding protein, partial [Solobacterium sp.]|nr:penicillin-binding protein [Solobacterium sp.]
MKKKKQHLKENKKMAAKRSHNYSVQVISLVTLVACLILASDVFYVAVGKMHLRSSTNLEPYIDSANVLTEKTKALRGNIFDSKGNVIAQDTRTYNVVCILDENRKGADGTIAYVKDKERTAEVLARCLRTDYDTIYNLLQQDVYQTELGNAGRGLSKAVKDEIESYELPGIEFTDSIQRIYPIGQFASHLIGYAKQNENGSTVGEMGLELYLNSFLEGKDGSRTYQVDQYGYVLPGMKENIVSAVNGNNVYLTLNSEIQKALEQALEENKQHFGQQRAWASVVEVKTGK